MVQEHSYSNTVYNTTVAVMGPLPPPLGGVCVHVQRTIQKLTGQGNTVIHYDQTHIYPYAWMRMTGIRYVAYAWYMAKLGTWLMYNRPRVIIYHIFYARAVLPELWVLSLFKKIVRGRLLIIDHDCRHMYERSRKWKRLYSRVLASVDQLVLIGSVTARSYTVPEISIPAHTSIESAFLPPDITHQEQTWAEYPASLKQFLSSHAPCMLVSAFACTVWQGQDLYGLDQALHAYAQIRTRYANAALVIVLATMGDRVLYQRLHEIIEDHAMASNIYILQGNYLLWPLFKQVALFIRPTLSDGASVSVQEALFCGTATIASDVCWRPHGTVLYKTADVTDLRNKIESILDAKGYTHDHQQRHSLYTQSAR